MQAAAEVALDGLQSVVDTLRLQLPNNRDLLLPEMRAFHGVRLLGPAGSSYALPEIRAFHNNSVKASGLLLKKAMVVTVLGKKIVRHWM